MHSIHLKNIRVFTNHGCLTEEEKIGSDYLVNLRIEANLSTAAKSDSLSDTIDYVHLNTIVVEEMQKRSKLLEHVGQRIINRVLEELDKVQFVDVSVAKVNPPIGGDVAEVIVTMTERRE
jgi:dihydroneopterin aldolase